MEDAIKTLDASNGNLKYQNAIERTKTRLDFALAQGVLLMPSRMIINTESIVGYNNNLTRVTNDMKLCVNNHINLETRKASLRPMAGRPSKINPPNSHPSNPIHKKATEAQGPVKHVKDPPVDSQGVDPVKHVKDVIGPGPGDPPDKDDPHHVNKALVALGGLPNFV